jgi:CYTH domain-containing protein
MEIELELTYLAARVPEEIRGVEPRRIFDVMVPEGAVHPHLRLRQSGDRYEITKKQPVVEGDASKQSEMTIPLEKEEFEALISASELRVVKDRYYVEIGGVPAEVDVFREKLEGLVLIDFEFGSEAEKDAFEMPSVALADVTQEKFAAGGLLAGKSYEDIEGELGRFGYKKL